MNANLCNDDLYPTITVRHGELALDTSALPVQVENLPDSTLDNASQPILLDHFRFGTWIGSALTTVRHLKTGWDGYGAPKIDWQVIRKMSRALANLQPADAYRVGAIVPAADGSLQAEWHLEQLSVEFCIDADLGESLWVQDRSTGQATETEGAEALADFERLFGALRL